MVSSVTSSRTVAARSPTRLRINGEEGGGEKPRMRTRTTYGAHEEREGDGLLGAQHGERWTRGIDARDRDGMGAMLLGSTQFVRSFSIPRCRLDSLRSVQSVCQLLLLLLLLLCGSSRLLVCVSGWISNFFWTVETNEGHARTRAPRRWGHLALDGRDDPLPRCPIAL
jgi:hypothetical protein